MERGKVLKLEIEKRAQNKRTQIQWTNKCGIKQNIGVGHTHTSTPPTQIHTAICTVDHMDIHTHTHTLTYAAEVDSWKAFTVTAVRTLRSFFIRNKHRLTLLENGEHICPWTAIIVIVIGIAPKKGPGIPGTLGFPGIPAISVGSRNLFELRVQHAKREKPNWQAMLGQLPKLICQLSKKRAKSCNLNGQAAVQGEIRSKLHLHRPEKEKTNKSYILHSTQKC